MISGENEFNQPICSQCNLFQPPKNIRKPYGFLMFSGGRERVCWEPIGYTVISLILEAKFGDILLLESRETGLDIEI